jgi:hypothetical protein
VADRPDRSATGTPPGTGSDQALERELIELLVIARGQQAHLRESLATVIGLLDRPPSR